MKPTWQTSDKSLSLYRGDCRLVLPELDAESFTACITDPPYHLTSGKKGGSGPASLNVDSPAGRSRVTTGFMGKAWDGGGVAFDPATWAEVLRVLKPGAMLLAFGGTRTYHRLTCAIEDAGFEIRDCIMWVYGSGFPKSLDISKAIDKAAGEEREVVGKRTDGRYATGFSDQAKRAMGDICHAERQGFTGEMGLITAPATDAARLWHGYGTALKPAVETIVVAMKPLNGTFAENAQRYGVAGLNVDGCRVGTTKDIPASPRKAATTDGWNENVGRWPANLIHDGSEEVLAGFPESAGQQAPINGTEPSRTGGHGIYGEYGRVPQPMRGDSGSAARFFKSCEFANNELLFCRAKAILYAWNLELANTADASSRLSSRAVVSVLSRAVIAASHGGRQLSDAREVSTTVTPKELRAISESLIAMILSLESGFLLESQHGRHFQNGCRAKFAAISNQTGTITITISHWKSDGSAEPVIFSITPLNSEPGAKDSPSRFRYCAKASRSERGEGNKHPTVKPLALMEYLVRLVTMPSVNRILDPFAGSGTTLLACYNAFIEAIGIDLETDHLEIMERRVNSETGKTPLFEPRHCAVAGEHPGMAKMAGILRGEK